MTEEATTKLSFRLKTPVYHALSECAAEQGYEPMAYIQKVLGDHALASGKMTPDDAAKLAASDELIAMAIAKSRTLNKQGLFTENFVLTVFEHLMEDDIFRSKYEKAIGGTAYTSGLPGKSPLNMYLGWYIKNAIDADPKMSADGKPVRVQVKNQPIQSYTRLIKKAVA